MSIFNDENGHPVDRQRFPLGTPINRPPPAGPTPVPGRKDWFYDRHGEPYYVDPDSPVPPPPERTSP